MDGTLDTYGVPFDLDTFSTITPADGSLIGPLTGYADSSVAPDVTQDEVALWDVVLDKFQAARLRWLILNGATIS